MSGQTRRLFQAWLMLTAIWVILVSAVTYVNWPTVEQADFAYYFDTENRFVEITTLSDKWRTIKANPDNKIIELPSRAFIVVQPGRSENEQSSQVERVSVELERRHEAKTASHLRSAARNALLLPVLLLVGGLIVNWVLRGSYRTKI